MPWRASWALRPPRLPICCKSWLQARLRWSNTSGIAVCCYPPLGKKRALEVVRHHRLIETFLYEVLDYPIDEVHEEAERLEHFISERFEERIAAKLGHPKIDPHGHCIPAMDGAMPRQNSILLTDAVHEGIYVVDSVSDRNARTLETTEGEAASPLV